MRTLEQATASVERLGWVPVHRSDGMGERSLSWHLRRSASSSPGRNLYNGSLEYEAETALYRHLGLPSRDDLVAWETTRGRQRAHVVDALEGAAAKLRSQR